MPIVAIIAILGVIVTAGYILLVVRRVFFGNLPENLNALVGDVSVMDKIVIVGLSAMMILMGILPTWSRMVPLIESGIAQILVLVGGA